jgi:hypothetical protein
MTYVNADGIERQSPGFSSGMPRVLAARMGACSYANLA